MKKFLILIILLGAFFRMAAAQSAEGSHYGESEDYRRSSLCLILLTHKGTRYVQEVEQQFLHMPLPERHNEHNLTVRVLNTDGMHQRATLSI